MQFFRYVLVGAISALFDTGIFMLCTVLFHTHYLIAQTFGFLVGISINYLLSIAFIFESRRKRLPETALFFLTGVVGLLLSYLILFVLIDLFAITMFDTLLAKLITITLVLGWNFASRKFFVF